MFIYKYLKLRTGRPSRELVFQLTIDFHLNHIAAHNQLCVVQNIFAIVQPVVQTTTDIVECDVFVIRAQLGVESA